MGRIWTTTLAMAAICAATLNYTGSLAVAEDSAPTPIGKKIESFSLPDTHGKLRSLDEYQDKLLVVAFIGTECPLAKTYAPRLQGLAEEFASQGVAFVGIDSNLQDTLSEIADYGRVHEVKFPLLKDNNNEIADRFGAVRTPEVFLLDKDRVVRYWGRIDDQYGFKTGAGYVKPKLRERFLADAIRAVLAGTEVGEPVVSAAGCFIGRKVAKEPTGDITYSKHVASILQDRCVECHRDGEVAPFTLTSYDDVIGWADTISEVIDEGRMPPWFADPKHGDFVNDARLTDEEKQTIYQWVDNGCPEGDAKDLPEPREFVTGWRVGEPDQVIYMRDEPYSIPAEGVVDYQYFSVDPGWTEDKWIRATEARPGNRSVVHHILVFVQPPAGKRDSGGRGGIGGYAPGTIPNICQPGTAMFVPAGSTLRFQLHYTPNGSPQTDRSMVGVCFTDPKDIKKIVRGGICGEVGFEIPPGDPNHEVTAKHRFLRDTLLLKVTPHMHLRGKSFKYEVEYPDGSHEVLLDVPNYDFNWQISYIFSEPKLMPRGTRMTCTAHFDNSEDNPANPDPTKAVTYGDQTWEEMMFGFYTTVDPKQDLSKKKELAKTAVKTGRSETSKKN